MRTRGAVPTRASKGTNVEEGEQQQEEPSTTPKLPVPAERPSKTFILPTQASDDARFVTLPNPRTEALTRYLFCPETGVYEFTVVASSTQQPRSILFAPKTKSKSGEEEGQEESGNTGNAAGTPSIAKTAEIAVATPIDVVFFMIPLLSPSNSTQTQAKKLFQPIDDIIDSHDELPQHLRYVLYHENFRETLQQRVETVCDTVEAGDEKMFRFNETKFLQEMIVKAERMVNQGLPASLEERFIRQALATPMMAVKRETNPTATTTSTDTTTTATPSDNTTPATETEPNTDNSTPATEPEPEPEPVPVPDEKTDDAIAHLLRLSTALTFLKESYISSTLSTHLDTLLAAPETSPLDFKPLHERLQHIADLRAEALASRSLGDFSRKRGAEDFDDISEVRAEKKRREEEEKKKAKAGQSRGVKDLQKVNTSGMKKMSDFFGKSAAAAKKKA